MNKAVKITIVVDNKAGSGLDSEHGFAAWIEAFGRRILFDTGQGHVLAGNAARLGIPLDKTDHVVLSHGHYDHGGGIVQVMEQSVSAIIHLHPHALIDRYSLDTNFQSRPVGLSEETVSFLDSLPPERVHWITHSEYIAPGIGLTGPIPRTDSDEDVGGPFYTDLKGSSKDIIEDDQALWIDTDQGLVVCSGCAHSGIINTLNCIKNITGKTRIRCVVGGFHLMGAGISRVQKTVNELENISPELIAPCHCTGDEACVLMKKRLGNRFVDCMAGTEIVLPLTEKE
ncbi:MAG: MBL fold metallo-hydrolase [Desulfonatronovibrio sp.]